MDPEEQVNKSNQDVDVWRMNGDNGESNGDNYGESLILLVLFWGDTYLSCSFETFEENEMLYIFFFLFSQVGILYP